MIHKVAVTDMLVSQLFELANTPFLLRDFRMRWEEFGWSYEPGHSDEFGFHVYGPNHASMNVVPHGSRVILAILPFYAWEGYELSWHADPAEYERERVLYEAEFLATAALGERILPPPILRWRDADKNAHAAIAWAGDYGVLVLQQAACDLQFGMEINFWLMRCTSEEFAPHTPLIDWLCAWGNKLHEGRAPLPLQW